MYNRFGTFIAVLMAAFPFLALGYKIFQLEPGATAATYAAIVLTLLAGIFMARRLGFDATPVADESHDTAAVRTPAAPIAWSWDGVNRQPAADEPEVKH
jgi:hypothetical protein